MDISPDHSQRKPADTSKDKPAWAGALLVILGFQVVYWLALAPIAQLPKLEGFNNIPEAEVAILPSPTPNAVSKLKQQDWMPAPIFWTGCCDDAYHAFRYDFELAAAPDHDLGLIAGFGADNVHIWINGFPLVDDGDLSSPKSYWKWRRGVLRISRAMLREGENSVLAITARHGGGYTDLFPQTIGDYEELKRAGAKRAFFKNDYRIASMLIIGAIGVVALTLSLVARNPGFWFWLATLACALSLRIAFYRWNTAFFSPAGHILYYFAITNLVPLAWFNFLDVWSGYGKPALRWVMSGLYTALMLVITIALLDDHNAGYNLAGQLTDVFFLGAGLAAGVFFFYRIIQYRINRPWEIAAITLALTTLLVDSQHQWLPDFLGGMNAVFSTPFLAIALVAAIAARNLRIYESAEALNRELESTLREKEKALSDHFEELQKARSARELAEDRQRILRDMHDGVGSQLTGLLVQARADKLNTQELTHGLEVSLNDLHLIVESLDAPRASFHASMASLRTRLDRQFEAANIAFSWHIKAESEIELSPKKTLHLSRIIQEATSNIIRHSAASEAHVEIKTGQYTTGPNLTVLISDNGVGMDVDSKPTGFGLANIRRRAEQLNGSVYIETSEDGAVIRVVIPLTDDD